MIAFIVKFLLTLLVTLVLSIIGAGMVIGVRLMIDKARRERSRTLRIWQVLGLVISLVPLMLVAGLGLAITGQRDLGSIAAAVVGGHLFWLAIAATIATGVLIFSGDLGNDAKAWYRFRQKKIAYDARVDHHRNVYRASDSAGVHAGMELAQGTKLYKLTYGEPPVLPPLERDVEQFLRDRFSNALPARRNEADDPSSDNGA